MPQLNFSIPDALLAKLDAAKPEYLDRKGFLCLLLDRALDTSGTLGLASVSEASTSISSIPLSINKPKNKKEGRNEGKKRAPYPDAFEQFWRSYQSLPQKASKQSKPLAHDAWAAACVDHAPANLQRAVERQLEIQRDELNTERGFTVAMPDCFRWLRDECFVALLEDHAPIETYTPTYTVL
jgi:hypothetical protein